MDLATLYPQLSAAEKRRLYEGAGISAAYLSQLANGVRKNPPIDICLALVKADERLTLREMAEQWGRLDEQSTEGQEAA